MLNHRANYSEAWLRSLALLMKHFVDSGPAIFDQDLAATLLNVGIRKLHDRATSPRGRGKYKGHPVWSKQALRVLEDHGNSLNKATRDLAHEHVIPLNYLIRTIVLATPKNSPVEIFRSHIVDLAAVVILTREQDIFLREAGLASRMPKGWRPGDDLWARYRAVGLYEDLRGI